MFCLYCRADIPEDAMFCNDNTVQVWDAVDGGNVFIYRGHTDDIPSLGWSPDGTLIASGDEAGTVRVWEAI